MVSHSKKRKYFDLFKSRVLRRIFGSIGKEIEGRWSAVESKGTSLAGQAAYIAEVRNGHKILVLKSEIMRDLRKLKRRWNDTIKWNSN